MIEIIQSGAAGRPRRPAAGALRSTLAAAALLAALPTPGWGQGSDWGFSLTPYIWAPSLSVSTDTPFGTAETDQSFADVVSSLSFVFMLSGEAHNGRWGVLADVMYLNITTKTDTPFGVLFNEAVVDTTGFVGSLYGEYRLVNTSRVSLDVLAGMRIWSLDFDVGLKPGLLPKAESSAGDTWVDPVFGLRGRWHFAEDWFATVTGDVGGFGLGSELTWQVVAGVGYQIDESWSVQGGYRALSMEREIGGLDVEMNLHGPIIGGTYRF